MEQTDLPLLLSGVLGSLGCQAPGKQTSRGSGRAAAFLCARVSGLGKL